MVFRRTRLLAAFGAALALASGTARMARAQSNEPSGTSTTAPSPAPSGARSSDPLIPEPSSSGATGSGTGAPGVDPAGDQAKLVDQGKNRPTADGTIGERSSEVYSEDWWAHTRPIVELHGYFRTRAELFHNFSLGRGGDAISSSNQHLWAQPLDNSYTTATGQVKSVANCGTDGKSLCQDKTEATANLRLRLNPEIHVSDNLRIMSQIDMLDNLVLGSTSNAYAMVPSGTAASGYRSAGLNGYAPLGIFTTTQGPPTAGVNSYQNSIDVQRAWAEYLTPFGQLRFGRMPFHWGLGMLYNSGDGLDHDYQTNVDRIMFTSGIKSMDLYFGGSWGFVATGPTSASPYDVYGGQAYNTANLTNVGEWSVFAAHRTNPELQRLKLSRNDVVFNGGIYAAYRKQVIDVESGETPITTDTTSANNGLEHRGAAIFSPDVWVQVLWNKLRVEAEAAAFWGYLDNSPARNSVNDPEQIRSFGLATQAEFRAVEDKLRVQFGAGWASGDSNVEGLAAGSNGLSPRQGDGAISGFAFHPSYQVDYIFFRQILTTVQNAYYFRPSVEYDFIRSPNGQKLGGGAAVLWDRASQFTQTPGNKRDLGIELDLQIYYQSKDGVLNDDPNKLGGFYSALQYGVFFPLGGLDYLPGEQSPTSNTGAATINYELSAAQTVRLILGVLF